MRFPPEFPLTPESTPRQASTKRIADSPENLSSCSFFSRLQPSRDRSGA
jgi:hypothetical protein